MPERELVEKPLFSSLTHLENHYGIRCGDFRSMPYPYNVLLTEWDIERKLDIKERYTELLITATDRTDIYFHVKESFPRNYGLYYIPVMSLYQLWQDPERIPCAELLTAVCAYLHIEAGISFYREEDSYMYYNYEILEEWVADDSGGDEADRGAELDALKNAKKQGDFIGEKMLEKSLLNRLGELVSDFFAASGYEKSALTLANEVLRLRTQYPKASLYTHANYQQFETDEDYDAYENGIVAMSEYIGFVGSVDDCISDSLLRMVNDDFNEHLHFQEPELETRFNEPQTSYSDELDYEYRLFSLMDDLCTLLHQQP